jgi:hypothetical protein
MPYLIPLSLWEGAGWPYTQRVVVCQPHGAKPRQNRHWWRIRKAPLFPPKAAAPHQWFRAVRDSALPVSPLRKSQVVLTRVGMPGMSVDLFHGFGRFVLQNLERVVLPVASCIGPRLVNS